MNEKDLLSELRIDPAQRQGSGRLPKNWRWLAGGAGGLMVVLFIVYFLFGRGATEVEMAKAEPPPSASHATAVLDATGYITARREATVASKVTGRIAEVLIEEGETVKAGQILARLDDSDQLAQVALSNAQLKAATAQLGQLEAKLAQAERDLKRQQNLRLRSVISQKGLEDSATSVATLTAELAAQHRQIDVAKAALKVAEVAHTNTIIRAPFAGIVITKSAQPGEMVSPISAGGGFTRTGIGTIVDMDSLEIEVDVNEAFIHRVTPKQPVVAVLDAYPDWKIPAEVIAIIPTADRSKATVKVRIAIKMKDPRIVPDMGVRVTFYEEAPKGQAASPTGVLIPADAIQTLDGHSSVFVVDGDKASRRTVNAGQSYGDLRLVKSGIELGEKVVRNPPEGLEDGSRIKAKSSNE
jgi:RND family efflux transporter MFP subunit